MRPVPIYIGKPPIKPTVPAPASQPPSLLTLVEIAHSLQCSKRHVENEITRGHLPVVRLGRLVRVDPADLASYLHARKSGGSAPLKEGQR